jgi:tetratricopeptide (TPR) repeat protein
MLSNNELNALNKALKAADSQRLEDLAKQAVSRYPKQASTYYYLAEAYFLQEKGQNAAACLAKAIELAPDNADYLLRLARQRELEGAQEDAYLLYRKAYALAPNQASVIVGFVKYYLFEEQDSEAAMPLLQEALQSFPENAALHYLQAQAFKMDDELDEALIFINKSLAIAGSEAAFVLKINLLLQLGEQADVLKTQQQLIAFLGKEASAYQYNFAQYLMGIERFDEAIPILQELSAKTSYQTPADHLLALAYVGQRRFTDAIDLYTQLMQQQGVEAGLLTSRAEAYQACESYDLAIQDFEAALQLLEGEDCLLINEKLGHLYYQKGAFQQAIEQYKGLTTVDWYAKSGYFYLGKTLYAAESKKEAFEMLQKAVKRQHREAAHFLEQYFAPQLQQLKMRVLQKNEAAFASNAQSTILQALSGKLCRIDVYKNTFDKNTPKPILNAVRTALQETFYVFSPRGMFCYNNIDQLSFCSTFRIIEEEAEDLLLEVFELDKSNRSYQLNISIEDDLVVLEPQKLKANSIVLKCIAPSQLSKSDLKLVQKYASKQDLAFLGEEVADLVEAVFES